MITRAKASTAGRVVNDASARPEVERDQADLHETDEGGSRRKPGDHDRAEEVGADIQRAEQPGSRVRTVEQIISGVGQHDPPRESSESLGHHRRGQHNGEGQDATFGCGHPATLTLG